uniref:Secreted protein n=1 Tax=Ditylenchus dipsaci TaxID=166011 RepID=A0A915ECY3_9BILA
MFDFKLVILLSVLLAFEFIVIAADVYPQERGAKENQEQAATNSSQITLLDQLINQKGDHAQEEKGPRGKKKRCIHSKSPTVNSSGDRKRKLEENHRKYKDAPAPKRYKLKHSDYNRPNFKLSLTKVSPIDFACAGPCAKPQQMGKKVTPDSRVCKQRAMKARVNQFKTKQDCGICVGRGYWSRCSKLSGISEQDESGRPPKQYPQLANLLEDSD